MLEGVDTLATITLSGRELARTANMHRTYRPYRPDVRELLDGEPRDLEVTFTSPVRGARCAVRGADAASVALGWRPQVNTHPFNAVRRMACGYVTGRLRVHGGVERSGAPGADRPLVARARLRRPGGGDPFVVSATVEVSLVSALDDEQGERQLKGAPVRDAIAQPWTSGTAGSAPARWPGTPRPTPRHRALAASSARRCAWSSTDAR